MVRAGGGLRWCAALCVCAFGLARRFSVSACCPKSRAECLFAFHRLSITSPHTPPPCLTCYRTCTRDGPWIRYDRQHTHALSAPPLLARLPPCDLRLLRSECRATVDQSMRTHALLQHSTAISSRMQQQRAHSSPRRMECSRSFGLVPTAHAPLSLRCRFVFSLCALLVLCVGHP